MRADEARALREQLTAIQRRLRRERTATAGLPSTTLRVLAAVRRAGNASPGDLATDLQMTSSNVAAALRALVAGGLVERRVDPADGRRALLRTTAAGDRVVDEFRREQDVWLRRAASAVLSAEEQRALLAAGALLQRLADHDPSVRRPGSRRVGAAS